MKRLFLITTAFLFLLGNVNKAQSNVSDALVYLNSDWATLGFYDLNTQENYSKVWTIGSLTNQIYYYNENVFVVCSGDYSVGDSKLIIIPISAFGNFVQNQDTTDFQSQATVIPLEEYGNAWSVVGINENEVLVTLASASKFQIVNFRTGEVTSTISDGIIGNPQGACDFNNQFVAVAFSDWGMGANGNSVALVNKENGTVEQLIPVRKNVVDVKRLANGNLLAVAWGDWFGEENFGTVSLIDSASLQVTNTWYPADSSKANRVVEINDRFVHLNLYASDFSTVTSVLDLERNIDTVYTDGLLSKFIIGKYDDNFIVTGESGLEIYSFENELIDTIPGVFPMDIISIPYFVNDVENTGRMISQFRLDQNYPNPFNPETTINYSVKGNNKLVSLNIYDVLGRKVTTLVNKIHSAGNYSVKFNAKDLNSGVYFYTLQSGKYRITKKMILMK